MPFRKVGENSIVVLRRKRLYLRLKNDKETPGGTEEGGGPHLLGTHAKK